MLQKETLFDVVGTLGCQCGVLRSFSVDELSKEMSSKILLCGDGYYWKTFKLVACLIMKGKIKINISAPKSVERASVLHQPNGVRSQMYHIVPYRELNGVSIALVASTTTYSDISLSEYDSFIFNLTHEEFVDELAHIISPLEYDHFYFKDFPDQDIPVVVASTVKEGVTLSVVDMMVENEKISSKKVNIHTWFTLGGNGIDVVVLVDSIRAISKRFSNTAYGFFLAKKVAYPVVANYNNPLILEKWLSDENLLKEDVNTVLVWVKLYGVPITAFSEDDLSRSSYARVMIELRADVELKGNIVVAMLKITKEGHYTCNVHVEYEWKPPRCSSCMFFGHIHEECLKNMGSGEKKTVKKPSQTS
nr:hypothetical protein [Tanacetum cinerariifolium]